MFYKWYYGKTHIKTKKFNLDNNTTSLYIISGNLSVFKDDWCFFVEGFLYEEISNYYFSPK